MEYSEHQWFLTCCKGSGRLSKIPARTCMLYHVIMCVFSLSNRHFLNKAVNLRLLNESTLNAATFVGGCIIQKHFGIFCTRNSRSSHGLVILTSPASGTLQSYWFPVRRPCLSLSSISSGVGGRFDWSAIKNLQSTGKYPTLNTCKLNIKSWPRATSQEVPRGQLIETVCLSGSKKAVICIIKCCKQSAPKWPVWRAQRCDMRVSQVTSSVSKWSQMARCQGNQGSQHGLDQKGKHPKTGPRRSTPARHRGERLGRPSRIPVSNVSRSHKAPRYSTRKPSVFPSKTTLQQTASESWEEFSCPATCFHATCLLDFTNLLGSNKFQRYDHD